eukprot:s2350_g6.t1
MDTRGLAALQQESMQQEPTYPTVGMEALSDFITLGGIAMKGRLILLIFTFGLICGLAFWLWHLMFSHQKHQPKMHQALAAITAMLQELERTQKDRWESAHLQGEGSTQSPAVNLDKLEGPLQCIDAKLLQLDREAAQIKDLMARLDSEQALAKLETLLEGVRKTCEKCQNHMELWQTNVPPKIKEMHGFTSHVPAVSKLVQSLSLDCSKQFAMAETLNDGLLKQQRETLHFLQGDNKEITAKLVRAESALDELKSGQKQLSLDVHVSRTKGEQKLDSIQKDLNSLSGSTSSSFRGLNVMVPQTKTMQDRLVDMTDYLVKNHQFNERMEGDTRVLEAATNSEDRLVRLEASMMSMQETLSELSDHMQQVRECQTLMQDQCQVILDRTPKLPKRPPPAAEAAQPQTSTPGTNTMQPPQAQPAPQTVHLPQHVPQYDQNIPIRLSDHLQPMMTREGTVGGYMLDDPLSRVSTEDILRTLLRRRNL